MQEFIFWKHSNDQVLVNHSRYWSSFDGHFGARANQHLLANLLARKRYIAQTIPKSISEKVYEEFEKHLSRGPVTVTYDQMLGIRIGHDFAELSLSEFENWLKSIRNTSFNTSDDSESSKQQEGIVASVKGQKEEEGEGEGDEKQSKKEESVPTEKDEKASWFSWFRVVPQNK